MTERVIVAGSGGQGVMLLGKVLAEAAMREGSHVTWLPSYGAEVRGGVAYCTVVVSGSEIGSPYIERPDTLILMNEPALLKFKSKLDITTLLVVNSSLVSRASLAKRKNILAFPFTDIALELGNIKVANMVALGSYLAKKKTVGVKTVFRLIEEIAPPGKKELVPVNQKALMRGTELIKRGKG